jgi:hypothetical protein
MAFVLLNGIFIIFTPRNASRRMFNTTPVEALSVSHYLAPNWTGEILVN